MQQWLEEVDITQGGLATTASTVAFPVADRQHFVLTTATTGSANYTMKFQVSNQITKPDFSASASATNRRSYVQVKEVITGTNIDGATGISQAWADAVRKFLVNDDHIRRIGATITARSAWTVYVYLSAKNNQ